MDFDNGNQEESKVPSVTPGGQPARLFSALTQVYGGVADPFYLEPSI